MSRWTTFCVGDVADVFDGPHATPAKTNEGPWFLSISSLKRGYLDLAESAHVCEGDFVEWTRRVTPEPGDILFSYETRLGEAALMPVGIRASLGRRMGILRPKRDIVEPRFLLYAYLASEFQETIRLRSVRGATVDRIPLNELPSWPISLPPLPQQRAIVAVRSPLDDKSSISGQIKNTARLLAVSYYRRGLARSTEYVRLDDITILASRGIAPQYVDYDDGLLVLNQRCIRNGWIELGPARRTIPIPASDPKRLRRHDVVVNSTGVGTLGRIARWTRMDDATVDSHVTILRFDPDHIDPVCASYAMHLAQPVVERLGEGSTGQIELHRARLMELSIAVPSQELQRRLRPLLEAMDDLGEAMDMEVDRLSQLRETLLTGLFSGQVALPDAERRVGGLSG